MKKRLVLFALPLVAMAITGCNKKDKGNEPSGDGDGTPTVQPLPNEYSLMKNWAANPSEEVYSVLETETETKISYADAAGEKSDGWEYVARSFAFDAQYIARFSEYKKISFTGKLAVTSGSNVVMIKVEGDATNTYEAKFNFGAEPATYELPLSFVSDWTKVNSLLFFVDRETSESGSGMMTFTKFVLSKEEVNPAYNIASNMPAVPQDWNFYKGGETFDVTYRWGYDTKNTITTAEEQNAIAKFSWNGKAAGAEWAYVSAIAKGDAEHSLKASGFKRIAFKVVGTENVEVMFKFQTLDNTSVKEVTKVMTGAEQIIEVDVTAVLAAANDSDEYRLCIFPAPNAVGEDKVGQLVLKEAKFDKTEVTPDTVYNSMDLAQVYIDKFDRKDPCYTVATENHVQTITLDKQDVGWESIQYKVNKLEGWFNEAEYTKVTAKVTSDKATHVKIKPYDCNAEEINLTLAADTPVDVEETIDAANVDLTKVWCIFISYEAGDAVDAVVTIEHLKLLKPGAQNVGKVDEYLIPELSMAAQYTCDTTVPGEFSVNYTKTAPNWDGFETLIAYDYDYLDSLKGELVSTVDTHLIFKPADSGANEINIKLEAGVAYKFDKKLAKNGAFNAKFWALICFEEGDAVTGKVTFRGLKLYASAKSINIGDYGSIRINNFWRADDCYSVSHNGDEMNIAFDKASAGGWESMAAHVAIGDGWYGIDNYVRVAAVLKADVNVKVLLKAYDANAGEHWVNLVANEEQTVIYTVDASIALADKDFILFIAPGADAGALKGNLTIKSLALMRKGASAVGFDNKVYITDLTKGTNANVLTSVTRSADGKGMTVVYDYDSSGFDACEFFLSAFDATKYNHVSGTVTSTVDVHVMLKPFDKNANETTLDLKAGIAQAVDFDINVIETGAQWACKQIMFIATDGADALSGSITFADFAYSIK